MFLAKRINKNFKIFTKTLNLSHKVLYFLMEPEKPTSNNFFRGVPETLRYKPVSEFSLRNILRIQAIHENPEKYFDQVQLVCGWSRTVRFFIFLRTKLINLFIL